MSSRASDFGVFLIFLGTVAFVVAMWALGMVHSPEAVVGFLVFGYAIVWILGQVAGLALETMRTLRRR